MSGENPLLFNNSQHLIGGRFRLTQMLGKGSFGQVFYAEDIKFDPPKAVALKLLHSYLLNDPQVREDIKREASTLARFNHPNILRVIDYEVTLEQAYIVTDFAEGGSLARKIRPDPTKPPVQMPLPEVFHYLEQIADALDEAHSNNLLHRDIKPLNILLDRRGRPLLADFGLAATLSNSQNSSVLMDINPSGTPLYMAPEQWGGRAGKASDIYSLAILVYQLITGQVPYQGNPAALAYQHLNKPFPLLNEWAPDLEYPKELDQLLSQATAKDPRQRLRPAGEFANRFKAILSSPSVVASPPVTDREGVAEPETEVVPRPEMEEQTEVVPSAAGPQSSAAGSKASPKPEPTGKLAGSNLSNPLPLSSSQLRPRSSQTRKSVFALAGVAAFVFVGIAAGAILLLNSGQANRPSSQPTPVAGASNTLSSPTTPATVLTTRATAPTTPANSVPGNTPATPNSVPASGPSATLPGNGVKPLAGEVAVLKNHKGKVTAVSFSKDGKLLASGGDDNTIVLYDASNFKVLFTLVGHTGPINCLAFSPNGKILASASTDKTVRLWDTGTGQLAATAAGHASEVFAAAFSTDGKILASSSADTTLKFWDVPGGKLRNTLMGTADTGVRAIAFSPDGKTLAAGREDGKISLFDLEGGKDIEPLAGPTGLVSKLAYSPDGSLLAVGSEDHNVYLWDTKTNRLAAFLKGHTSMVTSVSFSRDGNTLASSSLDQTARLWDMSQGTGSPKELTVLKGPAGLLDLAFNPAGATLAACGADSTVTIWEINR